MARTSFSEQKEEMFKRVEKVDEAITKVCGVFDELDLTNEEIRHVAKSVYYEAARQQEARSVRETTQQEDKTINKMQCWTTAASIAAIILSMISIILRYIS